MARDLWMLEEFAFNKSDQFAIKGEDMDPGLSLRYIGKRLRKFPITEEQRIWRWILHQRGNVREINRNPRFAQKTGF